MNSRDSHLIFEAYQDSPITITKFTPFAAFRDNRMVTGYHSSMKPDFKLQNIIMHIGSEAQAIARAEYQVNETWGIPPETPFYLYQISVDLGKLYPNLVTVDYFGGDDLKDLKILFPDVDFRLYNTVVYTNQAEDFNPTHTKLKNRNLSVILLTPLRSVKSIKMIRQFTVN